MHLCVDALYKSTYLLYVNGNLGSGVGTTKFKLPHIQHYVNASTVYSTLFGRLIYDKFVLTATRKLDRLLRV